MSLDIRGGGDAVGNVRLQNDGDGSAYEQFDHFVEDTLENADPIDTGFGQLDEPIEIDNDIVVTHSVQSNAIAPETNPETPSKAAKSKNKTPSKNSQQPSPTPRPVESPKISTPAKLRVEKMSIMVQTDPIDDLDRYTLDPESPSASTAGFSAVRSHSLAMIYSTLLHIISLKLHPCVHTGT